MVMPRSRSRSFESMTRSSMCWWAAKVPDCCSSLSTSVVLPWSTWAMMATLRRLRIDFQNEGRDCTLCRGCVLQRTIFRLRPSLLPQQDPDPMDTALLAKTAAAMVAKGKGILAADESSGTCEKRFQTVKVECTEENRRAYRQLLFGTPGIEQYLSGVILFDETARQKASDGPLFPQYLAKKGVIPGIKVDKGTVDIPFTRGEKVTEGLDGLSKRMEEYFKLGCRFAKWRAVITIGEGIPTHTCLYANAHVLARYAAACQAASIVPMIEPEVLLDGDHSIERCEEVTEQTLRATYAAIAAYNVVPEFLILKTSMVVSGKNNPRQAGVDEVAERQIRVLKRTVPAAQPGIVFLSGGQSDEAATAHLSAMAATKNLPWPLTFSYSPPLQNPALNAWRGQASNVAAAQKAFYHRAHMNSLAAQGKWRPELEKQAA